MQCGGLVQTTNEGLFTHTVNVTVFVSGIFDLFDGKCKQHHMIVLNPFLNGTKNGDIDGMCKPGFIG